MEKYSEAYYEKTLQAQEKALPSDHPSLATSYYKKALNIQEKSLPWNHPDLVSTTNNIGSVYDVLAEHSRALSYFHKVFAVQ
jgi:tetratricopeptide (TPR) repeat protein